MNATQEVFDFLSKRTKRILGKPLKECTVLDVFAGDGSRMMKDYIPLVGFVEAWDKQEANQDPLTALGGCVQIVDSYRQIRKEPSIKHDIVIVDNFLMQGGKYEHFDLFPYIYQFLQDKAYLILNVFGNTHRYLNSVKYDRLDDEKRRANLKEAREAFYGWKDESDPMTGIQKRYEDLAAENGFKQSWSIITARSSNEVYFLTQELVRPHLYEEIKDRIVPLKGTAHLVHPEPEPEPQLTTMCLKVKKTDDQTDYFDLVKSIDAKIITFGEQLSLPNVDERYLVIRHDVDDDFDKAFLFAFAEQARGIRATYFILPTATYFDYSEGFGKKLCDITRLGHEVGYHNNALVEYLKLTEEMKEKDEGSLWEMNGAKGVADIIKKPLNWIRSLGIEVKGTASHGDSMCREVGFNNYEVWEECPEKSRQKPKGHFPSYPLSHFGLSYEAYFVRRDAYLSESGSHWYGAVKPQIPPFEVYDQTDLMKTIEAFNKMDAGVMQLLVHPQWWSVGA